MFAAIDPEPAPSPTRSVLLSAMLPVCVLSPVSVTGVSISKRPGPEIAARSTSGTTPPCDTKSVEPGVASTMRSATSASAGVSPMTATRPSAAPACPICRVPALTRAPSSSCIIPVPLRPICSSPLTCSALPAPLSETVLSVPPPPCETKRAAFTMPPLLMRSTLNASRPSGLPRLNSPVSSRPAPVTCTCTPLAASTEAALAGPEKMLTAVPGTRFTVAAVPASGTPALQLAALNQSARARSA
ncbi:hypothetical protein D9M72_261800 [compost metagenome]